MALQSIYSEKLTNLHICIKMIFFLQKAHSCQIKIKIVTVWLNCFIKIFFSSFFRLVFFYFLHFLSIRNRKERAKQSTGDASMESPSTTTTESKPKRASRSQTAVIADQVAKVEAKMEAQRVKNNLYAKR